jgi:hypothetical protein
MEAAEEISKRLRVRLWLLAWSVALVATVIPVCISEPRFLPVYVMCVWKFPVGTAALAFQGRQNLPEGVFIGSILGGWILYIALSVYGLSQRRRARYFVS